MHCIAPILLLFFSAEAHAGAHPVARLADEAVAASPSLEALAAREEPDG